MKSDNLIVSHFHPFLTISCISYIQHSLKQEFSINTIIHHTVTAHVLCVLNNHNTQAAAHVEQQQPAQNPPGYALSSCCQNINSTTGPSNTFNLNGQEPGTEYNGFKRNIVDQGVRGTRSLSQQDQDTELYMDDDTHRNRSST